MISTAGFANAILGPVGTPLKTNSASDTGGALFITLLEALFGGQTNTEQVQTPEEPSAAVPEAEDETSTPDTEEKSKEEETGSKSTENEQMAYPTLSVFFQAQAPVILESYQKAVNTVQPTEQNQITALKLTKSEEPLRQGVELLQIKTGTQSAAEGSAEQTNTQTSLPIIENEYPLKNEFEHHELTMDTEADAADISIQTKQLESNPTQITEDSPVYTQLLAAQGDSNLLDKSKAETTATTAGQAPVVKNVSKNIETDLRATKSIKTSDASVTDENANQRIREPEQKKGITAVEEDEKDLNAAPGVPEDSEAINAQAVKQSFDTIFAEKANTSAEVAKESDVLQVNEPEAMVQLEKKVERSLVEGKNSFEMKLQPEGLGKITVDMNREDDKLSVQITVGSEETRKLFEERAGELRAVLAGKDYELGDVTVKVEASAASQNSGTLQDSQLSGRQNPRQNLQSFTYGTNTRETKTASDEANNEAQQWRRTAYEGLLNYRA